MSNVQILAAMKELKEAAEKVSLLWNTLSEADSNALCDDYPFEASFDEVVLNVSTWIETAERSLQ